MQQVYDVSLDVIKPAIVSRNTKIDLIEVYLFDPQWAKENRQGTGDSSGCGLLMIYGENKKGAAEFILPHSIHKFDLVKWASVWMKLKRHPMPAALAHIESMIEIWGADRANIAKAALLDLESKQSGSDQKTNLDRKALFEHTQSYFSF
ncbi:hypothetical protein PCCS19_00110 [Paenibacillus sp. CCS19]|uniref:hypothetical protein n=1 Tax=Paenibacillus sp. CCS19 TaxID=3158387 RepID=UPI0025654476|nr:hypothetical protein [Paenibacillus cellulosilyticus]GMK36958.1 hypothetical protein PCCS19_00110 [Paenibacillus cellulosilyticus]